METTLKKSKCSENKLLDTNSGISVFFHFFTSDAWPLTLDKKTDWKCLGTECWRKYLYQHWIKEWQLERYCIMRSFIFRVVCEILLDSLNSGEYFKGDTWRTEYKSINSLFGKCKTHEHMVHKCNFLTVKIFI